MAGLLPVFQAVGSGQDYALLVIQFSNAVHGVNFFLKS